MESEQMLEQWSHKNTEFLEVQENSSQAWKWQGGKWQRGGGDRRRFTLHYYPNQRTGIKDGPYFGRTRRRRRHPAMPPRTLPKNGHAADLHFCRNNRNLCLDSNGKCLDAGHDNDLYFHPCHNGGNQNFWLESWGEDRQRGATHIHVGGNMRNRRRHACVDYGGGRLYIYNCHNGNNQRFVQKIATTTTTTRWFKVKMVTNSFPEKISWKIMDITKRGKPKAVRGCSGKGYEAWYTRLATGCKLRSHRKYQVQCQDTKYSEGWAGGYLLVDGKKICEDWAWNAKKRSKKVKLAAMKKVSVIR